MQTVLLGAFIINLLALTIYDLKFRAVPDYLLLIALILAYFTSSLDSFELLKSAFFVSGAFVILNFIATFYIQNIKSRIYKDENLKTQTALGEGDTILIASFGAILGLNSAIFVIFLGAIFAIFLYIYQVKRAKNREIPFIPPLALAFVIEYFLNLSKVIF